MGRSWWAGPWDASCWQGEETSRASGEDVLKQEKPLQVLRGLPGIQPLFGPLEQLVH